MKKASIALLSVIVAAGANGTFAKPTALTELVAENLVETNAGNVNENGEVAVRATEAGYAYGKEPSKEEPISVGFVMGSLEIAIPAPKRASGAGRSSKYPFAEMTVGQNFFVAAANKEEQETLFKALGSTALSAKRRFATETGEVKKRGDKDIAVLKYDRNFEVRRIDDGAPWGQVGKMGVACWRTE